MPLRAFSLLAVVLASGAVGCGSSKVKRSISGTGGVDGGAGIGGGGGWGGGGGRGGGGGDGWGGGRMRVSVVVVRAGRRVAVPERVAAVA